MSAIAIAVATAAALVAGLSAASDGALLALDSDDGTLEHELASLRDRRERTHRALAFGRVVAHLTTGAALAVALRLASRSPGEALLLAIGVALLVVLITESGARSLGDSLGPRAVRRLLPFIRGTERVLAPVVLVGTWLDKMLNTMLPQPAGEEEREAAAEQFLQVVAAEADVSRQDETLMTGVFALPNTEVHEVMLPRVDVVAIDREAHWSEVIDRARSSAHARLPVYDGTIDHINGILHAKDLIMPVIADQEPPGGWQTLIRPATYIPRTKTLAQQLRDFQSTQSHMAIVVDEFGGTAGLVTIEDVLEEIVGEIRDEYDDEEAPVMQEGGRRFWVSGRLTLDELSDLLAHDLKRDGVTTVGGLMYELLGRVPKAGEELVIEGFRVVIERMRRRRVERVYFERSEQLQPIAG